MDVLRFRSTFPSILRPVEYYNFKRNFQPKLAPPRKKPAFSSAQLTPAKYNEEFGVTISRPTLNLQNGHHFTFVDGTWVRNYHCKIRKGGKKPIESRHTKKFVQDQFSAKPNNIVQSHKNFKDQYAADRQEVEDYYKSKLEESERRHWDTQDKMRREHEALLNAKQSQIDALIIKCNEYKGENNLLQIKLAKTMDLLAECAAEVNLQEAELAEASRGDSRRSGRPFSERRTGNNDACPLPTDAEDEEYEDGD
ncbi:uncharacterized protein LOC129585900 [Paramacrobiotus metropolitanus]|uniref:uncharacterized protein LOC129585900 n=1 Tax=Paramacrobiotus metropolitanus TaxID=2943436 RepID=UPI002445A1B5|nr:uncharacterized protein LOC129585900 [Paramacrobiotus metropolitanus]